MDEKACLLKPGEEAEDLGRADYRIIQKKEGFRFGTDAVLLAWFAAEKLKPGAVTVALFAPNSTTELDDVAATASSPIEPVETIDSTLVA